MKFHFFLFLARFVAPSRSIFHEARAPTIYLSSFRALPHSECYILSRTTRLPSTPRRFHNFKIINTTLAHYMLQEFNFVFVHFLHLLVRKAKSFIRYVIGTTAALCDGAWSNFYVTRDCWLSRSYDAAYWVYDRKRVSGELINEASVEYGQLYLWESAIEREREWGRRGRESSRRKKSS